MAGCESRGPEVHPVNGKVVFEKGDLKKLAGANVEFESITDPKIHAYGAIKEDGTFSMNTQTEGIAQTGAVPGDHRVRILFEVEENDDRKKRPPPPINSRFTRFDSSGVVCSVPVQGLFVIKLSRK